MSQPSVPASEDWPRRATLAGLLLLAALLPPAWSRAAASTYFSAKFALLGLVTVWLVASLALGAIWKGRIARPRAAHVAMLLFVGWSLVATLTSVSPAVSFLGRANYGEGLLSVFSYGVILYAASSLEWTTKDGTRLALALSVGLVAVAAIVVLQLAGRDDFLLSLGLGGMGRFGRPGGTLGNPVFLGGYAIIVLPVVAALALQTRNRAVAAASGLVASVALFLAVASFTRAAWVGLFAAAVVFALISRRALAGRRARAAVLVGMTALALGVSIAFFRTEQSGSVLSRIASVLQPQAGSAAMRPAHWRIAARMVADRPILGWGPSEYRMGFDRYATVALLSLEAATSDDAHNIFLNVAATTGVVGIVLFAAVLVAIAVGAARSRPRAAVDARKSWPRTSDEEEKTTLPAAGAAAALAGYIVWAQFNPSSVGVTPLFWLLAGTILPTKVRHIERTAVTSPNGRLALTVIVAGAVAVLSIFPLRYLAADQAELTGIVAESEPDLLSAAQLNPWMPSYWWELGQVYRKNAVSMRSFQQLANSEAALKRALQLSPEFSVYVRLAATEVTSGQMTNNPDAYRLAVRDLTKALQLRPLSGIARFNLGYVYFMLGDYENAARYFEAATRIPPPDVKSYLLLGQSLENLGRRTEATAAYRAALKIDPSSSETTKRLRAMESAR